jgi:hypothetical protein
LIGLPEERVWQTHISKQGIKAGKVFIMSMALIEGKLLELWIKNTPRSLIKCEVLYLKSYNEKKLVEMPVKKK